jgi:type 1 glutamine amidotransferase
MRMKSFAPLMAAAALIIGGNASPRAQGGRGGGAVTSALFTATDTNKDAAVTRDEFKAAFSKWFADWDAGKAGALTQEQLLAGLNTAIAAPAQPQGGGRGAPPPQNQTPNPKDVEAMMAALPDKAPAKPKQPRKVLVLAKAAGFVHSSIPLAARTVEEMGRKTGAWATTITYDPADINEQNLKQYDAIFLASTTGEFLDDPNDAAATAARRKALLDFVRGGKGLAGIHAASDSYHRSATQGEGRRGGGGRGAGAGFGGGRGAAGTLSSQFVLQGDRNGDQKLSAAEFDSLAEAWFDKLDTDKTGRLTQQAFADRASFIIPPPLPTPLGPTGFPIQAPATQLGPDNQIGTWPEFNKMIGGFFKFHWNDGQVINVKVDEPDHPLNAPFKGKPQLQIVDETYTFGRDTYSRTNLRVLTSVDYAKMSAEDKAKEQFPRSDGDYALSWIRREGKGRVFYEAHGHNEKIYAIKPILEHVLLGMQYVLGDLPADDSPSVKGGTK